VRAAGGPVSALADALRTRWRVGSRGTENVVLPLSGGSGAFLTRSAGRRLVTTATRPDAEASGRGVLGWLEKRQARRSAFLVVPDRATGVAIALRWGISPERLRLAEPDQASSTLDSTSGPDAAAPWHSRG
jgi:hypothetical protein